VATSDAKGGARPWVSSGSGEALSERDPPPPKIVYIAGWGRSGSTLLDQILGQIDGWFSCGELNLIWWDLGCGCGTRVFECDFWRPILREVRERHADLEPSRMIAFQEKHLGTSPATLAAIALEARYPGRVPGLRRYARLVGEIYEAAASRAGARVLVDSSKTATEAYLISALTDIQLYLVHLVRDPRAVAHSWGRRKAKTYEPLRYFGRLSPARSSGRWLRRNAVIEVLVRRRFGARYLLLRYEDFAGDPQAAVRSICELVGEPDAKPDFLDRHRVRLTVNHTVSGNPTRFASGELEIRADEVWKESMTVRSKALATLVAAPLMHRYGYHLLST
jgi:hypothetical protein